MEKALQVMYKHFTIQQIEKIMAKWNEPHRYYHNMNHLKDIIKRIDKLRQDEPNILSDIEYYSLLVSAFFHDVIYFPDKTDNEERSIDFFNNMLFNVPNYISSDVIGIIRATKDRKHPLHKLERIFWEIDNNIFISSSYNDLIEYENNIFKEFQYVDYSTYVVKRIEFLESNRGIFTNSEAENRISFLIDYIKNRKPRVGVYAGSFNPLTIGHKNIIDKSQHLFDKVIIAFGQNPDKPVVDINIPESVKYIQCDKYNSLLTEYVSNLEKTGLDVTIIRGLRNGADLDYETNQMRFIKDIKPDTKFIYLSCDKDFEHISSSAVRSLMKFDEKLADMYILK